MDQPMENVPVENGKKGIYSGFIRFLYFEHGKLVAILKDERSILFVDWDESARLYHKWRKDVKNNTSKLDEKPTLNKMKDALNKGLTSGRRAKLDEKYTSSHGANSRIYKILVEKNWTILKQWHDMANDGVEVSDCCDIAALRNSVDDRNIDLSYLDNMLHAEEQPLQSRHTQDSRSSSSPVTSGFQNGLQITDDSEMGALSSDYLEDIIMVNGKEQPLHGTDTQDSRSSSSPETSGFQDGLQTTDDSEMGALSSDYLEGAADEHQIQEPATFTCYPSFSDVSGGQTFNVIASRSIPCESYFIRFSTYGKCKVIVNRNLPSLMIGNDVIPAAKRRGSHEITVQVINESGNTIGDFPFEYKDTIANKLVDGLLKKKKNDGNWRKGNGKGKGKGKGKGENKASDFLHSASNSNYPVDTPLLAYLCDVAAKKGAEHFFNALLKLGISMTALQHSDDCYKDFALTAIEHGHEDLAEKIVQYREENLKFDVSGTTLKKLIAAVDDVVSRAENESDTDSVSEYNDDSCGSGYGGDLESEEISTEENSEEEKELLLLDNEKSEDKSQYWWKILLGRCKVILFILITIFVLILFVLCSHYIFRNDGSPTMPVNSSEMFIHRSRSFLWGCQQQITAMKNQSYMNYISRTSNMMSIGYIEIFTRQPAVNEKKRVPHVLRNCCASCTCPKRGTAMENERSMKYVLSTSIVLVGKPGKSKLSLLIGRKNLERYSCILIDEAMLIKMSIIVDGLIILWLVSVWFYDNYSVSEGDHEVCRRPNFLSVVGKGHKNDTSYQGKTVAKSCMSGVWLIRILAIVLSIINIIVHTLVLLELDVKLSYSSTGESYSLDVEYPSSDQIMWYFGAEVTLFSCDAALGTLMLSIFLVGVFCLFRKCRRKCRSISSDINDVGKGHKNDTSYQVATSGMFRQASSRLLFPRVFVLVFIVIVSTMALSGHRNIPSSTCDYGQFSSSCVECPSNIQYHPSHVKCPSSADQYSSYARFLLAVISHQDLPILQCHSSDKCLHRWSTILVNSRHDKFIRLVSTDYNSRPIENIHGLRYLIVIFGLQCVNPFRSSISTTLLLREIVCGKCDADSTASTGIFIYNQTQCHPWETEDDMSTNVPHKIQSTQYTGAYRLIKHRDLLSLTRLLTEMNRSDIVEKLDSGIKSLMNETCCTRDRYRTGFCYRFIYNK